MSVEVNSTRSAMADEDVISLSEIFTILVKGKWWIAGFTVLFALCALVYLWLATPIYQSDALVQVESRELPIDGMLTGMLGGEISSKAEIEVVRSLSVLGDVVESLKLNIVAEPDYFPVIGRAVARRFSPDTESGEVLNTPWLWFSGYGWGGEDIKIERFEARSYALDQEYTLVVGEKSHYQLLRDDHIILTGKVGEEVQSKDQRVRMFISLLQARPGTRFNVTNQPLVSAVEQLSQRLSVSEKGKKTGVLSLSLKGPSRKDNARLLEAIIQRYARHSTERFSTEIQNILKFLEGQLPQMKKDVELAESKLHRFQQENQMETQAALDQEFMQLALDAKESKEAYTELLNKVLELKMVKASVVGNARILDHAYSGIEPVKPKKWLIFVLAVLLGGMCGTGLVFLRDMLRQGVKTPEEIKKKTGLSVFATIEQSKQNQLLERNARKQGGAYLLAQSAPEDLAVESLRSLRTNLAFSMMEGTGNRVMLTGPAPGIGTSFVSANLGVLLAESGKKVLLIDADMRKGRLNRYFGVQRGMGLSDILVGKACCDVIHQINEKCDLLTTGTVPPNPSELLMSPKLTVLLENVSQRYDIVLIDTPSILAVTDAASMGQNCSRTLMVARAEFNTAQEIDYAAERLKQAKVNVQGCILNGIPYTRSRYGQYRYYHYTYGKES